MLFKRLLKTQYLMINVYCCNEMHLIMKIVLHILLTLW